MSLEAVKMIEEKKIVVAWVGTSCNWCGWSGKVEVTEKDPKGNLIVRCPKCMERIRVE
jgi:hypothetical protein